MTHIDPRILPLIDTLSRNGFGWLAFNMLNELRQGKQPMESDEIVDEARRFALLQDGRLPFSDTQVAPQLIEGDDQLKWATEYVCVQLTNAIDELAASIESLEDIGNGNDGLDVLGHAVAPLRLVLLDNDNRYEVHAENLPLASEGVQMLSMAMNAWLRDALNREGQQ